MLAERFVEKYSLPLEFKVLRSAGDLLLLYHQVIMFMLCQQMVREQIVKRKSVVIQKRNRRRSDSNSSDQLSKLGTSIVDLVRGDLESARTMSNRSISGSNLVSSPQYSSQKASSAPTNSADLKDGLKDGLPSILPLSSGKLSRVVSETQEASQESSARPGTDVLEQNEDSEPGLSEEPAVSASQSDEIIIINPSFASPPQAAELQQPDEYEYDDTFSGPPSPSNLSMNQSVVSLESMAETVKYVNFKLIFDPLVYLFLFLQSCSLDGPVTYSNMRYQCYSFRSIASGLRKSDFIGKNLQSPLHDKKFDVMWRKQQRLLAKHADQTIPAFDLSTYDDEDELNDDTDNAVKSGGNDCEIKEVVNAADIFSRVNSLQLGPTQTSGKAAFGVSRQNSNSSEVAAGSSSFATMDSTRARLLEIDRMREEIVAAKARRKPYDYLSDNFIDNNFQWVSPAAKNTGKLCRTCPLSEFGKACTVITNWHKQFPRGFYCRYQMSSLLW
jgi:hypothetical protein